MLPTYLPLLLCIQSVGWWLSGLSETLPTESPADSGSPWPALNSRGAELQVGQDQEVHHGSVCDALGLHGYPSLCACSRGHQIAVRKQRAATGWGVSWKARSVATWIWKASYRGHGTSPPAVQRAEKPQWCPMAGWWLDGPPQSSTGFQSLPSHCLLPENQPGQEDCLSRSFVVPLIVSQREFCCQFCLEPCRSQHCLQPSWPHAERPALLLGAARGPSQKPTWQLGVMPALTSLPCLLAAGWGVAVRFKPPKLHLMEHLEVVLHHQEHVCGVMNETLGCSIRQGWWFTNTTADLQLLFLEAPGGTF